MKHPIYAVFGALVLSCLGLAQYQGWSLTHVNEVKNIPRSVRDNPGAYRSVYAGYYRYSGGK